MTKGKHFVSKYVRDFPEWFQKACGWPSDQEVMVHQRDFNKLDASTTKLAVFHPHLRSRRAMSMLVERNTFLATTTSTSATKNAQSTTKDERREQSVAPMSSEERNIFEKTPIAPLEATVEKHDVGQKCKAVRSRRRQKLLQHC